MWLTRLMDNWPRYNVRDALLMSHEAKPVLVACLDTELCSSSLRRMALFLVENKIDGLSEAFQSCEDETPIHPKMTVSHHSLHSLHHRHHHQSHTTAHTRIHPLQSGIMGMHQSPYHPSWCDQRRVGISSKQSCTRTPCEAGSSPLIHLDDQNRPSFLRHKHPVLSSLSEFPSQLLFHAILIQVN